MNLETFHAHSISSKIAIQKYSPGVSLRTIQIKLEINLMNRIQGILSFKKKTRIHVVQSQAIPPSSIIVKSYRFDVNQVD